MLAGCLNRTQSLWEGGSATQGSGRANRSLFPLRFANKRALVTSSELGEAQGIVWVAVPWQGHSTGEKRLSTLIE
jgi:hypothetical protein